MSEAEVEGSGQKYNGTKRTQVVERVLVEEAIEAFEGDKVGKEDVSKEGRHNHIEAMF